MNWLSLGLLIFAFAGCDSLQSDLQAERLAKAALPKEVAELRSLIRKAQFARTVQSKQEIQRAIAKQRSTTRQPARLNSLPARGVVLAVSPQRLVEISLGSDEGIQPGDRLEIFRASSYLTQIVIRRTRPERAVGEILKEYSVAPINPNDQVYKKGRPICP